MTGRPSPLRLAVVALAALAGLFAMHGLTHHGEHLPSHDVAHHAAGHVMAADDAVAAPTTTPAVIGSGAGAMAMCLSILLTGVLAWTAVRRSATGPLLLRPRSPAPADRRRPASRSHDPPSRWSLSVCRC